MIYVKCIDVFRDRDNKIYAYRIVDLNGYYRDVTPKNLEQAIKNNLLLVVNMSLTTNNELVINNENDELSEIYLGTEPIIETGIEINRDLLKQIGFKDELSFRTVNNLKGEISKAKILGMTVHKINSRVFSIETDNSVRVISDNRFIITYIHGQDEYPLFYNQFYNKIDLSDVKIDNNSIDKLFWSSNLESINIGDNCKYIRHTSNIIFGACEKLNEVITSSKYVKEQFERSKLQLSLYNALDKICSKHIKDTSKVIVNRETSYKYSECSIICALSHVASNNLTYIKNRITFSIIADCARVILKVEIEDTVIAKYEIVENSCEQLESIVSNVIKIYKDIIKYDNMGIKSVLEHMRNVTDYVMYLMKSFVNDSPSDDDIKQIGELEESWDKEEPATRKGYYSLGQIEKLLNDKLAERFSVDNNRIRLVQRDDIIDIDNYEDLTIMTLNDYAKNVHTENYSWG